MTVPCCWIRGAWSPGGIPQHLVSKGCYVAWAELHQSHCNPGTGTRPGAVCMCLQYNKKRNYISLLSSSAWITSDFLTSPLKFFYPKEVNQFAERLWLVGNIRERYGKIPLSLIRHNSWKACVNRNSSALTIGELCIITLWSFFFQGNCPRGSWVSSWAGLEAVFAKERILCVPGNESVASSS